MTDPTILGCIAIILALAAGYASMVARQKVHAARDVELRDAIGLLRVHCDAMQRLDDDATPESLLAFAVRLSALLHEPGSRDIAVRVLKREGSLPVTPGEQAVKESDAIFDDYESLLRTRPDLATAFMQVIVAGILSFEKRYPECAGSLTPHVSQLVMSPIKEAQRMVNAADVSPQSWRSPEPEPVAA